MSIEVGPNVGAALEQAAKGKTLTIKPVDEATLEQVNHPQQAQAELILVGIEMTPRHADKITLSGVEPHHATVLMGPRAKHSGRIDHSAFVRQLKQHDLKFHGFTLKKRGVDIGRGSLVSERLRTYLCKNCGAQHRLSRGDMEFRKKRNHGKPVCCNYCMPKFNEEERAAIKAGQLDPTGRNELQERSDIRPKLGADDPRVAEMFAVFSDYIVNPVAATRWLVPRVWGVYNRGQAPSDWVPEAGDMKARMIEDRIAAKGGTIRPFSVAERSGQVPKKFLVEATLRPDGTPGMAYGWIAYEEATGALMADPYYGFTVKLLRDGNSGKKRSDDTV